MTALHALTATAPSKVPDLHVLRCLKSGCEGLCALLERAKLRAWLDWAPCWVTGVIVTSSPGIMMPISAG
jgi:hypothetical protein